MTINQQLKDKKLKDRRWSFSSVNSYENCPKGFYLNYVEKVDSIQNAFAEWGSFIHELLEDYFNGDLEFFELSQKYEDEYEKHLTTQFPPNRYVDLGISYFNTGLDYLNTFEGLPSYYEVIAVEQKVELIIGGFKFIGYIDLVLRDKQDGKIIICDHKSKSKFKNKKELSEYLRQLYLYAIYIYQTFGEYPKQLIFNMFRAGDKVCVDFDITEYEKAQKWFIETIKKILLDTKFYDKIKITYKDKNKKLSEFKHDDFFCNYLCGVRNACNRSKNNKVGDEKY